MADRTVSVSLVAKVSGFVGGIATAKAATKDFSSELDRLAKTHKEKFNQITNVTAVAGLALTGVFASAIKAGMNFDKQMSEVGAVSGATGKSLKDLSNAALQAGKDTVFTATDAAKAEAELAKAGISTANILNGGLAGSLSLAAAGQMDLADAATIAAQAMNIFKLNGSAVPHIADVLASAANTSAADMQGLSDSLKQAGLVAAGTGATLEDTVGVLAAFADNALVGSDAGTSFKTMLGQLQAPSKTSAALMKQLGINAYDSSGKFIGLVGLAGQLQTKLGHLTQQERDEALAQIFGNDGRRAAAILYQQGAAGIQKYIDGVNKSGAATETAAQKMNNLSGDLEQLRGSLETLAIESSGGARDGLRQLTQAATGLVNSFMDLPGWVQQGAVELSGIAGISLLAMTGFTKARGAVKQFQAALSEMGPAGDKASKVFGAVSKWGGIAAVASVAGFALYSLFSNLHKSAAPVALDINKLTDSLSKFATESRVTGELKTLFGGDDLNAFTRRVAEYKRLVAEVSAFQGTPTGVVTGEQRSQQQATALADAEPIAKFAKNIADTDAAFANMVKNGQATQAAADMNLFQDAAIKGGMSLAEFNALFPQYNAAAQDAALSSHAVAQGFGSVTENTNLMSQSLAEAVKEAGSLLEVENKLHGSNISLMQATDALEASYDAANAAVEKNGKTANKAKTELLATTDAGRANREALIGIAEAGKQAAQSTLDHTHSLEKANDVITAAHDKIVALAIKMGLSKTAAIALADSMLQLPDVNPKVTVITSEAEKNIQRVRTELDKIKDKVVNVTVIHGDINRGGSQASTNRWGGVYTHAADGVLRQAHISSAVAGPGARYAYAEGGTGGEAFIPKNGDYARTMGILTTAASWVGASVWPGRARGGDGASAPVTYHSEMNVYAQNADPAVLDQYQRTMEIRQRVGRPR